MADADLPVLDYRTDEWVAEVRAAIGGVNRARRASEDAAHKVIAARESLAVADRDEVAAKEGLRLAHQRLGALIDAAVAQ